MGKGKIAAVAVAACMLLQSAGLFGCGGNMKENKQGVYALSDQEFTLSQLAGTDALGRRVEPTGGNIGGKYVAVCGSAPTLSGFTTSGNCWKNTKTACGEI